MSLLRKTAVLLACSSLLGHHRSRGRPRRRGPGDDPSAQPDGSVLQGGDAGKPALPDGGAKDASVKDATPIDAGPPSSRQVQRPLGSTASANGYYEYLPPGYDGTVATPLLVFWHGLARTATAPPISRRSWRTDRRS
ncbi:MAG: hypothetical protein WDN08_04545 [Rhizomicrobium sp.]